MKNNDTLITLGVISIIGIGAYFLFKNKKAGVKPDITENQPNNSSVTNPIQQIPQQSNLLNANKVLKIGVNGIETKELQRLLGISQDGIFGIQTETALFNRKGVKQITLNAWITTANVGQTNQSVAEYLYKVGDNLIVKNTSGTTVSLYSLSWGVNYTAMNETEHLLLNQMAGKVTKLLKDANTGKNVYMVLHPGIFSDDYMLVKEADVKKV